MSRLVLNSVFSYIFCHSERSRGIFRCFPCGCSFKLTLVVFCPGATGRLARLATPRKDDLRVVANIWDATARVPPLLQFRGIFQQLDDALQQSSRATAVEAAMVETERNLRLRYWNEF